MKTIKKLKTVEKTITFYVEDKKEIEKYKLMMAQSMMNTARKYIIFHQEPAQDKIGTILTATMYLTK